MTENKGDLISREALKKAIMNDLGLGDEENGSDAEYMTGLQDCYKLIDNAPTVEYTFEEAFQKTVCEQRLYCPQRPQGEWEYKEIVDSTIPGYCCSCCHIGFLNKYNFCPNCGAEMRGEEE